MRDIKLSPKKQDIFFEMVGKRYNPRTGLLTVVGENQFTRRENRKEAMTKLNNILFEVDRLYDLFEQKEREAVVATNTTSTTTATVSSGNATVSSDMKA